MFVSGCPVEKEGKSCDKERLSDQQAGDAGYFFPSAVTSLCLRLPLICSPSASAARFGLNFIQYFLLPFGDHLDLSSGLPKKT